MKKSPEIKAQAKIKCPAHDKKMVNKIRVTEEIYKASSAGSVPNQRESEGG